MLEIENVQQRPPINENPKVQQQTVQPQQQPIQKNYQADQQKKQTEQIEQTQKQQQMQQIEKQFSTQQNQQQQIIQQQQQQKQVYNEPQPVKKESNIKQLNASTSKFIEQEQLYTIVPSFKSFNLIQQECSFITNTCMKQPSIESNSQSLAFYTNLRQALQKQLLQLIDFVEQGKLRDDMYGKFIAVTFKDQYALLQKAQSQGDTLFIKRITNRMNILKAEQTLMQQNPSENFAQIVQRVKPNIMIPQSQKQTLKKPQQLQDNIKLDSIKIDKNAQKHLEENLDQLPIHVKYEALLKRYKEYYNYATYLSNHAKVKRKEDIEQALKLLEKGKQLRELFTQGQNPPIGNYLCNEMQELTLEDFHKMNQQQYKSCNMLNYVRINFAIQLIDGSQQQGKRILQNIIALKKNSYRLKLNLQSS
ncbi:unnamed protein product (macronuclear) [Paramecium tetraurelia]|uniref:Uncharacterized protein n=1 Tax=Paramecium tetraurelia TaxID=5888 RepID=A0BBL5_PARTE|nr:uncharacterized protein GSPATT00000367001 [Paramecium tetraurelia]CAK55932.1 unnamed protein product [Paramecium tetraurelia]|eukprot:XP_001423330.1 hypothetical protein (macronuclear) [Paramecium tetraurelia strain d4-2]